MLGVITGYDCTGENLPLTPHNAQLAGYTTGSGGVPWSAAQFQEFPNALRIVQDNGLTDDTADYADIETGAGTDAQAAGWYHRALANYTAGTRPGQRHPSIYASASNITPLVNALIAGGVTSGPGLIVANWDLTDAQAVADVQAAAGPFPIRGIQFHNEGAYDIDIWEADWVNTRSRPPGPGPFRHVLTGTIEEFAASRDANSQNMLMRSMSLWTPGDRQQIIDTSEKLIVYTPNP